MADDKKSKKDKKPSAPKIEQAKEVSKTPTPEGDKKNLVVFESIDPKTRKHNWAFIPIQELLKKYRKKIGKGVVSVG